jgi:hypothetical protein
VNTNRNQKQQMLAQVAEFAGRYASSFPKKTAAAELTAAIRSAVAKLSGYASLQVSSQAQLQASCAQRVRARQALWTKLVAYRQTAQALKIVDHNFLLPSRKNDAAMVAAAHSFAEAAVPPKREFALQGLNIDDLNAAVSDLEAAILKRVSSKQSYCAVLQEYDKALDQGLSDLARFEALVSNTMADDKAVMAAWNVARYLRRRPATKNASPPPPPSPAPDPPAPTPALAA